MISAQSDPSRAGSRRHGFMPDGAALTCLIDICCLPHVPFASGSLRTVAYNTMEWPLFVNARSLASDALKSVRSRVVECLLLCSVHIPYQQTWPEMVPKMLRGTSPDYRIAVSLSTSANSLAQQSHPSSHRDSDGHRSQSSLRLIMLIPAIRSRLPRIHHLHLHMGVLRFQRDWLIRCCDSRPDLHLCVLIQ